MTNAGMLISTVAAAAIACAGAAPAAAKAGDPIAVAPNTSLDIIANARIRYEGVDQANIAADAGAVTARLRLGAELKTGLLSVLVEGEGTGALDADYNDTVPGNGVEPFPVVADAESLELNRAQLSFGKNGNVLTVGRQRIAHDSQRFVGNVAWRQNEQTFDAVRGQARIGQVKLDAAWAFSQRTVFGSESPNAHYDGDLVLLNATFDGKAADVTAFAYILEYEARPAFSSATYGLLAQGSLAAGPVRLNGMASIATQSGIAANPRDYSVTYLNVEAGAALKGFSIGAGYELLGSDRGLSAFQTPLATLHAFNGWADLFLTTPAAGLQDLYLKAGYAPAKPPVPGLVLAVTYHRFDADFGNQRYGQEWDASIGAKLGPVALLAKFADYQVRGFGVDTRKVWLQAEYGF